MKSWKQGLLTLALASILMPFDGAQALDVPRSFKADSRVRHATYDAENVIQLNAVLGLATMIELEPGEEYVYHAYGDSEAYSFTTKNNYLFFKPRAEQADTNLLVLTNRRSYQFKVDYHEDASKALYKLVIKYPESEAAALREEARREFLNDELKTPPVPINWESYTMSGNLAIAPIHAWDDGRHTWLRFPPGSDLPAVYRVTPDGQETVANFHMAGARTMVLHHTAARWHLRQGALVLAVHNDAYGAVGLPYQTGTVSPQVDRGVVGAAPLAPILEDRPSEHIPASAPANESIPEATPADPVSAPVADEKATPPPAPGTEAPTMPTTPTKALPAATAAPVVSVGGFVVSEGDPSLMPTQIKTEGAITRMQFKSASMPGVFMVDEAGQEHFVGLEIEPGNILAIQAVSPRWKLLTGGKSLTIEKKEP